MKNLNNLLAKASKEFIWILIIIATAVGFYLNWDFLRVIFFVGFLYLLVRPLSAEVYGKIIISLLFLLTFSFVFNRGVYSENLAILIFEFMFLFILEKAFSND